MPRYTEAQSMVSEKVLSTSITRYIGADVLKSQGDIRDVISMRKLVCKSDCPLVIGEVMNTMAKYDNMMM
ncbi:MAG TPA: hypothetical protein VEL11_14570 [Candidatus Bathyarchaeia archaeon]|nr:hypothetical protein [Candidatus Bathyarchaeia archaeon]